MIKEVYRRAAGLETKYKVGFIVIQIILVDIVVYLTGGTAFSASHLMYIPIILPAFLLDVKTTHLLAFLSGLSVGPLMPQNLFESKPQAPYEWIMRTLFYVLIGAVVNVLFCSFRKEQQELINKSYEHIRTGYPNANKLRLDLHELVEKNIGFSIITIKLMNLHEIDHYVDFTIGEKSVRQVLFMLSEYFDNNRVYSLYMDELAAVVPNCSENEAEIRAHAFLKRLKTPILVDNLSICFIVKAGIVSYPHHGTDVNNLVKKIGRALDQANDTNPVALYNSSVSHRVETNFHMAVLLSEALRCNCLRLVYQPKINLIRNEITGFEALLRWNINHNEQINPSVFIKVAEETGIIRELTKWVVKSVVNQIKVWSGQGLRVNVAVNISSKDLIDTALFDYTGEYLKFCEVSSDQLEFELTERTLVENENKASDLLNHVKNRGMRLALDDYGMGFNSLVHLVKLPIDSVKIDKSFVDNIRDDRYNQIMRSSIDMIHSLGMQVVAEGAETKDQIEQLKQMQCDIVQGYYFGRPMPPEDVSAFIQNFQQTGKD